MGKQKDGRYRTKLKVGVTPEGKDINVWISGRTKAELEEEKRKAIAHYINGESTASDCQFGEYARKWFELKKATVAVATVESYRTAFNKDLLPAFGARKLRSISASELQAFVNGYAGMSSTKIITVIAALRGVFELARKDRILKDNPVQGIDKPKASEPAEKRALTEDERSRIRNVAVTHPQGAYLAAMYYLGARPGEIRGLRWGDFDWEDGCVYIQRDIDYKDHANAGDLKNRSSKRRVPVPDALRDILTPLRAMPDMYVFAGEVSGKALAKTVAERLWVELMLECGLVEKLEKGSTRFANHDIRSRYAPTITPHMLRHNYVTICWENGVDVYTTMRLVGHKSIKTTMDIYTHLSNAQMDIAKQQVNSMFSSTGAKNKSCQKVARSKR